MAQEQDLERLRYLQLVSKVASELENNLGIGDKTLAEFVIDLAIACDNFKAYDAKLRENGAELPIDLVDKLLRLVKHLHPKFSTNGSGGAATGSEAGTATRLTGLAIPNSKERIRQLDKELVEEGQQQRRERERQRASVSIDDETPRGPGRSYLDGAPPPPPSHSGRGGGATVNILRNQVHKGRVTNITERGCFVQLLGLPERREGLVHISNVSNSHVNHPSDVVRRNAEVWVKVISVGPPPQNRIGLSIRDVNQDTGRAYGQDLGPSPLDPRRPRGSLNGISGLPAGVAEGGGPGQGGGSHRRKQMSEAEIWETKQLIASGVLPVSEYPTFNAEGEGLLNDAAHEGAEEEVEIDLNEDEPPFLKGQTAASGVDVSPIRIVKVPDGSLQRAAMTQTALAKERREIRDQQSREMEAIPADLNTAWLDPMGNDQRQFATEAKSTGLEKREVPEWKQKAFGKATAYGQRTSLSITEQRKNLPIFTLRQQLIEAVHGNQILVVIGETGSGKTTQMTQYLAEEGYTSRGKIGCTQPRRVAALSVAKRVAEEFGCRLGEEVGYAIRFDDCTSKDTLIKYMTDGMLLREVLLKETLQDYSVIILDEAHERTIHTDVLFGLLKNLAKERKDLKIIVTSATLDAEKFSTYFYNCPIFTIPGRMFPVEILYTKAPESDYLDACLITVMQIHLTEPEGDILVFLTGQEEIDTACEILYERMKKLGREVPELIILPVYSSLPSEMQTRIFDPAPEGSRKCVVATNIAEASLTIDGIYYVVDPGFAKQKVFNPKIGMDSLVVAPISKASARQRAGRAGRTGPGKCYRLYTETAFQHELLPTSVPEIQRTNLGMTVLAMKAMGINDLLGFDFMDPPSAQTLVQALQQLYNLGALDEEGLLTRLGRKMAEFPLEPAMAKVLMVSVDLGCSEEILTVVAMLSAQNIFFRPRENQAQADTKHAKFFQPEGDFITLLIVYEAWKRNNFSNAWCHENFIHARSMKRAMDVRKQLVMIMDRYSLDLATAGRNYQKIQKAICSGYFYNSAKKDPQEGYKTLVEQTPVYIHPGSSLFHRQPDWIVYFELVLTTKEYMRECCAIEAKWLTELAPRFFKETDSKLISRRKRKERIEPLFDKYAQDQNAWRLSKRRG